MSHPHPELPEPQPLTPGGVRIVALGGLGEVGRNMTVIEHAGQLLAVVIEERHLELRASQIHRGALNTFEERGWAHCRYRHSFICQSPVRTTDLT